MSTSKTAWYKWPLVACLALLALYFVFTVYASGQTLWAVGILAVVSAGFFVYLSNIAFAFRYLFPGLAGMLVFVAFPLLYTAQTGFTNYSSAHLLGLDRVKAYLLEQNLTDENRLLPFSLHADGDQFKLVLTSQDNASRLISAPLTLNSITPTQIIMQPLTPSEVISAPLSLKEVIQRRDALKALKLQLPDNSVLSYAGVREFGVLNPVWKANSDGTLTLLENNTVYKANLDSGYLESASSDRMQPGFKVGVGLANYARMSLDPDFRGPFLSIFIWTVMFSALTVLFTLAVGLPLAVLLNWEALRFRGVYRTLLFLPYAVPAFISILVFKGLFNQNFGEINTLLHSLFGMQKLAWFADPLLAKIMILIVNTWLGYPYIMILCSGLIKSIPADLYEASAIAGASPWTNFFKITAPLIIKPLTPLLITTFAFNFNNFVVIALLTDGRPDYLNTKVPAGTTDILVSYTYRIAFQDSGQNFGLAAAVSTVIFFIIALLSLLNLKLSQRNKNLNLIK